MSHRVALLLRTHDRRSAEHVDRLGRTPAQVARIDAVQVAAFRTKVRVERVLVRACLLVVRRRVLDVLGGRRLGGRCFVLGHRRAGLRGSARKTHTLRAPSSRLISLARMRCGYIQQRQQAHICLLYTSDAADE